MYQINKNDFIEAFFRKHTICSIGNYENLCKMFIEAVFNETKEGNQPYRHHIGGHILPGYIRTAVKRLIEHNAVKDFDKAMQRVRNSSTSAKYLDYIQAFPAIYARWKNDAKRISNYAARRAQYCGERLSIQRASHRSRYGLEHENN